MPNITLLIYQRPAKGNAFINAYNTVTEYRHKITAIGGYMTASCRLVVEQSEAERVFREYMGCRVAVFLDNPVIPIWEGFITRAVIDTGAVQISKSLDEMYNSVIVQFSDGTGMTPEQTTAGTDATSIATYGTKQTTKDAGELYATNTTFAEAIRDQTVGIKAEPIVSTLSGSSQQGGVYLEMRGFAETLKWDTFAVTNAAATNIATQILSSTGTNYSNNGATFYDNTDTTDLNTHTSISGNRELGESSWDMLLRIVESGDYVFGISETNPNSSTRRAYFQDANRTVEYTIDAYGDGTLKTLFGLQVLPQWVRPDRSIRINNIALADEDAQEAYITEVEYDAEANSVQWYTDENASFEGVFNFDKFSKPINERFGSERRLAAISALSAEYGGTGADNSTGAIGELFQRQTTNGVFDAVSLALGEYSGVVDGAFDHWQDTSIALTGGQTKYTAIMWLAEQGTAGVCTVSQGVSSAGEIQSKYYLRWNQTSTASSTPLLKHRLYGVDRYQGLTITVSWYQRVTSGTQTVRCDLVQNYGTGGSPSSQVRTAGTTTTATTTGTRFSQTFTVPSNTGKTLGSNGDDYIAIEWLLPTGATYDWRIWNVQMDIGSVATPFRYIPKEITESQIGTYYETSYDRNVSIGTNTTVGIVATLPLLTTDLPSLRFRHRKWAIPSCLTYSQAGTANRVTDVAAAGDHANATTVFSIGQTGSYTIGVTGLTTTKVYSYHYVADARL